MVTGLNSLIQAHPGMINDGLKESASPVRFNDPQAVLSMKSEEGRARFFSQFKETQNFDSVVSDLNQAWTQAPEADLEKREALLQMAVGLMNFTQNDQLRQRILEEYDRFSRGQNTLEAQDYASKALQEYLDHETNVEKRNQELEKRGIPVIDGRANKTSN